jgi:hypothetical protein
VTPEQMLVELSDQGDQGSDYHDGLDGWFSWNIDHGLGAVSHLNITWQPYDEGS